MGMRSSLHTRLYLRTSVVATPSRPLQIAVFADTHDRFPADLPGRLAGADEIWHLGDVCTPETLQAFEALRRPLLVVRGNNDAHPLWPPRLRLSRHGVVCHLEHIAPNRAPVGTDLVLHGHTHVPGDTTDPQGVRWLNPGCITRPRAQVRSFAWLTISQAGQVGWELISL
jgi:uncharacterized protein